MQLSITTYQICDKLSPLRIGCTREVALWFIQQDIDVRTGLQLIVDQPPAYFYMVFLRVGLSAEFGDDLAIDGHLTGFDHFLCRSPRSDACLSNKFLKTFH